jgi:mRNA interferase RelE/StbE
MSWWVEWTPLARREAKALDRQVRERVVEAIDRMAETEHGDITSLKKPLQGYRLRVGDWRVFFDWGDDPGSIIILHVGHRSEAYRRE